MKKSSRRQFIKNMAGLAATTPFISCSKGQQKPPNIIFLLTDDQRWDALGCAGNSIIQTPNIDALADDGAMFSNAFVTTSICCTSRASIFSGQYARRHGIHGFSSPFSTQALNNTYPLLLKQAGYQTGFIGKWGVGNTMPESSFDYWKGIPGQPKYEQTDSQGNPKHLTSIMGDQAEEFLNMQNNQAPFCLSISFKAPHVQDGDPRQFIYDPQYKDLYKDVTIPEPETADPKYYDSFPEFFKKDNEARRRWDIRFSTPEKYQNSVKGYYRLITGVDKVVERIMNTLKQNNLDQNTIILYTGDNGFYLGEHGLAGKWYGHEESIRVPMIIHDPRLPKSQRGKKHSQMTLNIDIAPTILDYAGLTIPEEMQGKSLKPVVSHKNPEWRTEFFYEHLFNHERIPKSEGVVTHKFKYLRYMEQNPVYEELYDLENDPHEKNNLANNPKYSSEKSQLQNKCNQYTKSLL